MTCKLRKITVIVLSAVAIVLAGALSLLTGSAAVEQRLRGDADGDGKITVSDISCMQRVLADYPADAGYSQAAADVDGSGVVDINDATELQRWLAEFETGYPIGEGVTEAATEAPTEAPTQATTQMPTDDEGWGLIIFQP